VLTAVDINNVPVRNIEISTANNIPVATFLSVTTTISTMTKNMTTNTMTNMMMPTTTTTTSSTIVVSSSIQSNASTTAISGCQTTILSSSTSTCTATAISDAFDIFDHGGNRTIDVRELGTVLRYLGKQHGNINPLPYSNVYYSTSGLVGGCLIIQSS